MTKATLKFALEPYGGGCLWAADAAAFALLDVGPLDIGCSLPSGERAMPRVRLSPTTASMRDELQFELNRFLNPVDPTGPSLWTAQQCRSFNARLDDLYAALTTELSAEFEVVDRQPRLEEDPSLAKYLAEHPGLSPVTKVTTLTPAFEVWGADQCP